ncbi:MAG: hypothetical protein M1821_005245 [Bathelium mastoideum]|nr:MAG: hypothetical protein M1821_005245 [Bathelium mastoideum]
MSTDPPPHAGLSAAPSTAVDPFLPVAPFAGPAAAASPSDPPSATTAPFAALHAVAGLAAAGLPIAAVAILIEFMRFQVQRLKLNTFHHHGRYT